MDLDVAFLPKPVNTSKDRSVCVVIDVLRASSSIVTILERGAESVYPVHAVARARRFAAQKGFLLCGERDGLPLRGFDSGNSVAQLAKMDFRNRGVVLTTTNGTAALEKVARAHAVLVGCARNKTACAEAAVKQAARYDAGLEIVCAGRKGRFALDDAVCAGLLVDAITRMAEGTLKLSDSAIAAQMLYRSYPDLLSAFELSSSGRRVMEIGHVDDLRLCSDIDAGRTVPQAIYADHLVIRPFAPIQEGL
ncbi:MAG: 2-phosphosulfolactate phosphatase [Syntrophobacteraceae bacterium]